MKTKKGIFIFAVLVAFVFLTGCLNYKSYYQPPPQEPSESDLIKEIAEIEKELGVEEGKAEIGEAPAEETPQEVEEEISLPLEEEVNLSQLQRIEVKENELISLKIKASDPDQDKITYTFPLPLNEEGKWKTNYGDAGEYVITLTASDGLHTTKKDILLVVQRVNVPPIIKKIANQTIKEGETIALEPQVIDPNGDPVTVTLSPPLASGSWPTDHTSAGEYDILVTASDGELETKTTFFLTVLDVNVPPEITGVSDLTVKEGELVEFKPFIADLDNDPINLTISQPVGDDGTWQTTYTDHGTYPITLTVSDGKDTVQKTITLTVEDVNMPPEILEITLG